MITRLRRHFPQSCGPAVLAALLLTLLSLLPPAPAHAHPHAFVDAQVAIIFDDAGLAGFRQRWVIDEITSFSVLDLVRENGDGHLDKDEHAAIEQESFGNIKEFNYFTAIINQGKRFPVQWASDFHAELDGPKLVYEFFVPCHVTATPTTKEVLVAVFDPSFYTYVAYSEEGDSGIDPSADPLFRNTGAQASAEDFQRFSEAVGLDGYVGQVRLLGPADRFHVETEVVDAPELTYFMDQIVPQAFLVRFSTK